MKYTYCAKCLQVKNVMCLQRFMFFLMKMLNQSFLQTNVLVSFALINLLFLRFLHFLCQPSSSSLLLLYGLSALVMDQHHCVNQMLNTHRKLLYHHLTCSPSESECGLCSSCKSLQARLSDGPYLVFSVTISRCEAFSNNNSGQEWALDVYWQVQSLIKKTKEKKSVLSVMCRFIDQTRFVQRRYFINSNFPEISRSRGLFQFLTVALPLMPVTCFFLLKCTCTSLSHIQH